MTTGARPLRAVVAAVLGASLLMVATLGAPPAGAAAGSATPPRVLVISVPGLTWSDVEHEHLPAIERLADEGAIANLAPRSTVADAGPGDAYLTISAGSRATTPGGVDGQVLGVDERSSGSSAGDIFRRRTGSAADGPFVSLTWPTLVRVNGRQAYDADLGALATALTRAHVATAVVANADGRDSVGESYERQAGLALVDHRGVLAGGSLDRGLLTSSPDDPFGVRLDPARVLTAARATWDHPSAGGAAILVEASDLARTIRYRPLVDADRYDVMWRRALHRTDDLVAALLQQVDPARDTVVLVAPYNRPGDRDLTVVARRGPGAGAGYLRSASTQRDGYLTLVDVAPTVLDALGAPPTATMEGRRATTSSSAAPGTDRIAHLVAANRAARFREQLLTPTSAAAVVLFAVVVALAIAAHANRWPVRARRLIALAALVDLGLLPASYLIGIVDLVALGAVGAALLLATTAAVIAALAAVVGRRWGTGRGALVGVLAVVALVLAIDVVTGSHLSLDAALGYSATGNSRLVGISNYSFGQLAAASCLIAAWVADVRPDRRGIVLSIGVLGAAVVVLGVPTWGGDVGGVLALTPAMLVFAVLVTGHRFRPRLVVLAGAATALAIAAFGLLDLSRPADQRGHLGRLLEQIGDEGAHPLVAVVRRKLAANLEVSVSSLWVAAIPVALALWWFLRRFPDHPDARIRRRFARLRTGLAAALVAAVLGSALNDSGAIVAGVMAVVVGASLVALLMLGPPPTTSAPVRAEGGPSR